jgi:rubrerythrin
VNNEDEVTVSGEFGIPPFKVGIKKIFKQNKDRIMPSRRVGCPYCGYKWHKRIPRPKRCPRCNKKFARY